MKTGPDISLDGLVFGYDNGHPISHNTVTTRFNQGKPTTNLISAHNDNHVRAVTWTNSGTWQYDHNASNNTKPVISNVDMSKVNLMHGKTLTLGSQHFGCASQSVSASTTYTMSVYYFQNRAGASRPYFRQSTNNNNLGYLKYNGSTNTSNWPVGKWIRISVTVTTASNENACYMSNYLGGAVGDQVWYCAPMIEQNTQLTPFVDGTRSTTQSLIDLKKTTNINVSNMSFDSTGQPTFDGTDDYIPLTSVTLGNGNWSMEFIANAHSTNQSLMSNSSGGPVSNAMGILSNKMHYKNYDGVWRDHNSSTTLNYNQIYHIVFVNKEGVSASAGTMDMYINGEKDSNSGFNSYTTNGGPVNAIGRSWTGYFDGDIHICKRYTTSLSNSEVKQNYNSYKTRFGI